MAEFKVPTLPIAAAPAPSKVKAEKDSSEKVDKVVENVAQEPKKPPPAKEHPPVPYEEPPWSGVPPEESGYAFEMLKGGAIVDEIDLV